MTAEEILVQVGAGAGIMAASAVTAFKVGARRANGRRNNGTAPRWHSDDRELMARLFSESNHTITDHLETNTMALIELRSAIDKMSGWLEGRFSV